MLRQNEKILLLFLSSNILELKHKQQTKRDKDEGLPLLNFLGDDELFVKKHWSEVL